MSRKITPEGQHLNVAAMAWWRFWTGPENHPMSPELRAFFDHPTTRHLFEACEALHAIQEEALQRGTQGKQLDSDTSTGNVE